jgi:hypothetical protein
MRPSTRPSPGSGLVAWLEDCAARSADRFVFVRVELDGAEAALAPAFTEVLALSTVGPELDKYLVDPLVHVSKDPVLGFLRRGHPYCQIGFTFPSIRVISEGDRRLQRYEKHVAYVK